MPIDTTANSLGMDMKTMICLAFGTATILSGCASTYGNLVSGSNLGAQEYTPAVLPNPGMEGQYREVLGVCRNVATNRQITASQEAQLKTITGTVAGAGAGAAAGLEIGFMLKQTGFSGGSIGKSLGVGMAGGLISSLAGSFSSGVNEGAGETKRVLLQCLRRVDPQEKIYRVIE